MSLTLGELALRFGCELRGDPDVRIDRVGTLAGAREGALSFFANTHYRADLASTRASGVVIDARNASACNASALIAANPYATYARMAALLHPAPKPPPVIAASAVVDASARIGQGVSIGPFAVIGANVELGDGCVVGPGCTLAGGVRLGAGTELRARVTLENGVRLGARVLIHSGSVLGADGFGFARDSDGWVKVPQVGSVQIGDDVEIGANTTIDRGAIDDTVIGNGCKIDNQVQIGHNVVVGDLTVMAAFVGISGSTRIGKRCMIGGSTGFVGHLDICDDVAFTGDSMIARSIDKPGVYSGGLPAEPANVWRRLAARFRQLETLSGRVTKLERAGGLAASRSEPIQDSQDD
jgi:UDP-3-O-[3-hydroxymyristoyl] glucosamine N-acyltransferase